MYIWVSNFSVIFWRVERLPFLKDQKPLIYAIQQNFGNASPRQLTHLEFIGQFSNVVADTLSRIENFYFLILLILVHCMVKRLAIRTWSV